MGNITNHKLSNKENKRNDMNRPKGVKNNQKTPPRYENFNGESTE